MYETFWKKQNLGEEITRKEEKKQKKQTFLATFAARNVCYFFTYGEKISRRV